MRRSLSTLFVLRNEHRLKRFDFDQFLLFEMDGCTAVKVPVPIDVNQSAKFCAASAMVQKVFDRVTEGARLCRDRMGA